MARKVKQVMITDEQRIALEKGYRTGTSHCYRQRCQIILLKREGYKSAEIGLIVGCCEMSVNNWVSRFVKEGEKGLETRQGQGRKPVLTQAHTAIVRAAVEQERQRLSQAQQIIEKNTGKTMSRETLTRFLKVITAVTNA